MPKTVDVWVVWGPEPKKIWGIHLSEDAAVQHRDLLRKDDVHAYVSAGFVSYTQTKVRESDQT